MRHADTQLAVSPSPGSWSHKRPKDMLRVWVVVSAGRDFPLLWSPRGGRKLHLPRVAVRPHPLEVQGCRSQRAQGSAVPVPTSHLYAQLWSQLSTVPTTNPDEKRVVCGVSTRGDLASHRGSLQEEKPWEQGGNGGSSSDRALGEQSHPASISWQAQSHTVTPRRVSHSCCAERVREKPAPAVWHLLSTPYSFSLLYGTGQPEHSAPPPPEPTPPLTRGELLHVPFASWASVLTAWAGASLEDPALPSSTGIGTSPSSRDGGTQHAQQPLGTQL